MSNPIRRRQRTVFHYKVDAALRPEDRAPYFAMIRASGTTNEQAHAWLKAKGYGMSLSAVARHRRRLLAADAVHADDLHKIELFAKLAGSPDAPDFAAAARLMWDHLMFRKMCDVDESELIETKELTTLVQLVRHTVDMAAANAREAMRAGKVPADPVQARPKTEADWQKLIEDILQPRR